MPITPQEKQLIERARKGHPAALQTLVEAIIVENADKALSNVVYAICFEVLSSLDPSKLANARGTEFDAIERASYAFSGIGWKTFRHPPSPAQLSPAYISRAWPILLKWCTFFYDAAVRNTFELPVDQAFPMLFMTLQNIPMIFSGLLTPETRELVLESNALEFLAHVWLKNDHEADSELFPVPLTTTQLTLLMSRGVEPLDRFFGALGGDEKTIAKITLGRLQAAEQSQNLSKHRYKRTAAYLHFMGTLTRLPLHPLQQAFVDAGAVETVTNIAFNASKKLEKNKSNPTEHAEILDLSKAAFIFIAQNIENTAGYKHVLQSIKDGLIESYSYFFPMFAKDPGYECDLISKVFKDILPKYFIFRDVMEAIWQAYKLTEDEFQLKMFVLKAVEGSELLAYFMTSFWEYNIYLKELKTAFVVCGNVKCKEFKERTTFRTCGGCRMVMYCTEACQQIDWAAGHKKECKGRQEFKEGLTARDMRFIWFLGAIHAEQYLPTIRKSVLKENPDVPLNDYFLNVDYSQFPPKRSVKRLAELNKPSEYSGATYVKMTDSETSHRKAAAKSGLVVQNIIPWGAGSITMRSEAMQFSWEAGQREKIVASRKLNRAG